MRIAVLTASPRPDGNSSLLADAFAAGARDAGHDVTVVALDGVVDGTLRDCRACRRPDGSCAITDGLAPLVLDTVVPADAVVFAMPLYFYGMPGVLKTFFDRLVCYLSEGHPRHAEVQAGLTGQRIGLLVTSEEAFPALAVGLVAQLTELTRYLEQHFVGVVHGVGNQRGEVVHDPADPLAAARRFGRDFEHHRYSDYSVSTERSGSVWGATRAG